MLDEALKVIKESVNEYVVSSLGPRQSAVDYIVFPNNDRLDLVDFPSESVSILLVNVEEQAVPRQDNPHRRVLRDGTVQRVRPAVHVNAQILFAARFSEYKRSLFHLSLIMRYFLRYRLLDHENTPGMSDNLGQLIVELVTLSIAEQNNLWSVLRVAYLPSLLYKVRMVVFEDEGGVALPSLDEPKQEVRQ